MPNPYIQRMQEMQIPFEIKEHSAVWHMEDAQKLNNGNEIGFLPVKNLLLANHSTNHPAGEFYLVLSLPDEKIKFGQLARKVGISRSQLKFATPKELDTLLHTVPGMVSPLIVERNQPIQIIISQMLSQAGSETLGMHGESNTQTITMTYESLMKFLTELEYAPHVIDLS